jgi:hypothetical protein
MAITFEIDVSDIASLPLQCDVSEDRTVHRAPSHSQVRVPPRLPRRELRPLEGRGGCLADILQALRWRGQRHGHGAAEAPQIDLQAIVLVIDEQRFPVGTAIGIRPISPVATALSDEWICCPVGRAYPNGILAPSSCSGRSR